MDVVKELLITTLVVLIDLNNIAETSSTDGLHYDVEGHKKIADKLIEFIKTKFD